MPVDGNGQHVTNGTSGKCVELLTGNCLMVKLYPDIRCGGPLPSHLNQENSPDNDSVDGCSVQEELDSVSGSDVDD